MASFREVIDVPRTLDDAFAYVADFTTAAEWDPGIESSRRVSGDGGVGTRYAVQAAFRGKTVPFTYEVKALEPGRRIVIHGDGDKATSDDTITFEPSATGTRITYEAVLKLKGLFRVAEPFLKGSFDKLGRQALAGLRDRLSAPAA